MLLSAALIVKDEATILAGCLASLRPLVDEIVIHDTGSQDASVAVARQAGATVIEGTWQGDFAAARNVALAACSGEWVLNVDADDIAGGDPEALRRALESSDAPCLAFPLASPGSPVAPAAHLFRPTAFRWAGVVHEVIWPLWPWDYTELTTAMLPPTTLRVQRSRTARSERSLRRNLKLAGWAATRGDTSPFPGWAEEMAALSAASLGDASAALRWHQKAQAAFGASAQPPLAVELMRAAEAAVGCELMAALRQATPAAP